MTLIKLVNELERRNVKLSLAGDKLRLEAPAGVLAPELKRAISKHKDELVKLLSGNGQYTATIWPGIVVRIYPRPKGCVEAGHCVNLLCDYYPHKPSWCRQRVSMND